MRDGFYGDSENGSRLLVMSGMLKHDRFSTKVNIYLKAAFCAVLGEDRHGRDAGSNKSDQIRMTQIRQLKGVKQ